MYGQKINVSIKEGLLLVHEYCNYVPGNNDTWTIRKLLASGSSLHRFLCGWDHSLLPRPSEDEATGTMDCVLIKGVSY